MGDYKLIISRYDENVDWVKSFDDYVIFNKGTAAGLSEDILNRTYYLPNVGKEGEIILRYIITHYYTIESMIYKRGGNK